MKKIKLLVMGVLCSFVTMAQVTSWSDDFENYTVSEFLGIEGAANGWTTWSNNPGSAEDVRITSIDASSGFNSIFFDGEPGGGPQDVVLKFDDVYDYGIFHFQLDVKTDSGFYFNFQAEESIGSTWALDIECSAETIYIYNYINSEYIYHATVPFTQSNQWTTIAFDMDLDSNIWQVSWNGTQIAEFENPSSNQVASLDLFPLEHFFDFYVDNISYTWDTLVPPAPDTIEVEIDGKTVYIVDGDSFELFNGTIVPLSIDATEGMNWSVYPNPANEVLHLNFEQPIDDLEVLISDAMGRVVLQTSKRMEGRDLLLNVDQLQPGIYFLRVITSRQKFEKELIISR